MPYPIEREKVVVVLVDYQEKLMPAIDRGAEVLAEAGRLAEIASALGIRVIATEQNPAGLGPNVEAIRAAADETFAKMHFDACGDGLGARLGTAAGGTPTDVVIAGCEAHVCLMQTVLGLLARGLRVWVVATACGSRSSEDRALALERMRSAGATLVSVEMVAFEWLRSCTDPRFKAVLAVLKRRVAST